MPMTRAARDAREATTKMYEVRARNFSQEREIRKRTLPATNTLVAHKRSCVLKIPRIAVAKANLLRDVPFTMVVSAKQIELMKMPDDAPNIEYVWQGMTLRSLVFKRRWLSNWNGLGVLIPPLALDYVRWSAGDLIKISVGKGWDRLILTWEELNEPMRVVNVTGQAAGRGGARVSE